MDMNLIPYDMEQFFNKYTRFMTKNIYINQPLYHRFCSQYTYLYQELEQNTFLYRNNPLYKKIMDIKDNQTQLIKLHNQKYLKEQLKKYQVFFDTLYPKEKLDLNKRYIILSDEPYLLVINNKNTIPLITAKIKYLSESQLISPEKIFILTDQEEKLHLLKEEVNHYSLFPTMKTIHELASELLLPPTKLLDQKHKYQILKDYLINNLFPQKEQFQKLYQAFEPAIYLNKDYKEYDTFKDYHNYMSKRKFLSTGLSLKKYNEQEINKRKKYLRTINNETTNTKEEVDIANFLYLNSLSYEYHQKTSSFIVENEQNKLIFQYINSSPNSKSSISKEKQESNFANLNKFSSRVIKLYAKYPDQTTFLEKLVYELIKERYPLEKRTEDAIYERLKDTTIDSYFHELITKYFLPALDQYQQTGSLQHSHLTTEQTQELIKVFHYYQEYLEKHHLIEEESLKTIAEHYLQENKYQYLFLIGDIFSKTLTSQVKIPTMHIKENYEEVELLKENIKLLYDYKKYLHEKKSLPTMNTYKGEEELSFLTKEFLKDNLNQINQKLEETTSSIYVYSYEDNNRLKISQNITNLSSKIIKQIPQKKDLLIAVDNAKEINNLLLDNNFTKVDKNTIVTNTQEPIHYEEILSLEKPYSHILLPYLIPDKYHEDPFIKNRYYQIKLKLYLAITNCKNSIYLLCPSSKLPDLMNLLDNLQSKVTYLKD